MKTAVVSLLILSLLLSGCASILETERIEIIPHEDMDVPKPGTAQTPDASEYDELYEAVYDYLQGSMTWGRVNIFEYEGDLDEDLEKVRNHMLLHDPLASYALSDIFFTTTPIVSYIDIEVTLVYRRSTQQIEDIFTISTERYLKTKLLEMMSEYQPETALISRISGITEEDVMDYLREIYYNNPLQVIMAPIATVTIYPPEPLSPQDKQLIELNFGYSQPSSVLSRFAGWLESAARDIGEKASGENDAEIMLSLCRSLAELSEYDSAVAGLSEYSTQSFSATAYGALLNGSAIGEGYAMAYKALCDSLGIPCRVVLGSRDDLPYAWNIVSFDGSYYHIDPALCDEVGFEEGFFKDDDEMQVRYTWNRDQYPVCDGELKYRDIGQ